MVVFAFLFALLLRHVNGLDSFLPAALTAYALWLVVDWYDFAVVDVLLAPFDKFYRASGVSAFDPAAVKFHFVHRLSSTFISCVVVQSHRTRKLPVAGQQGVVVCGTTYRSFRAEEEGIPVTRNTFFKTVTFHHK